jgi:hypothetical protein
LIKRPNLQKKIEKKEEIEYSTFWIVLIWVNSWFIMLFVRTKISFFWLMTTIWPEIWLWKRHCVNVGYFIRVVHVNLWIFERTHPITINSKIIQAFVKDFVLLYSTNKNPLNSKHVISLISIARLNTLYQRINF